MWFEKLRHFLSYFTKHAWKQYKNDMLEKMFHVHFHMLVGTSEQTEARGGGSKQWSPIAPFVDKSLFAAVKYFRY